VNWNTFVLQGKSAGQAIYSFLPITAFDFSKYFFLGSIAGCASKVNNGGSACWPARGPEEGGQALDGVGWGAGRARRGLFG